MLAICLLGLGASSPALAAGRPAAGPNCGHWEIAQSQQAKDRRLKLTGLVVSEADCQATLLIGVDTGLFKIGPHNIGAYSLELQVQPIGAAKTAVTSPIGIIPKPILVWPVYDLRLNSTPDQPTANAAVNLLGSVTEVSYASDMALQALTYVVDATGGLGGLACVVPREDLAGLAVQFSDVFITAVKMLFRADWTAAKAEMSTTVPIFYEKVSDATVGSPLDCLGAALKGAGGRTGFVAQVVAVIVARSSAVIIDLLHYSGQPAAATVRYTSQQVGNGAPTDFPPSSAVPLDRHDFSSVLAYFLWAISHHSISLVSNLMGSQGVAYTTYGTEYRLPGKDNSLAVIRDMELAFGGASPTCVGFELHLGAMPDKAFVFLQGNQLNWPALHLTPGTVNMVAIGFDRSEPDWTIRFIASVLTALQPTKLSLTACPIP